jgi:bifunctional DNase/RNase
MGGAHDGHGDKFVEVLLSRIVIRENAKGQYIFLQERGGQRGFPMVIGLYEAEEIQRVVSGEKFARPLTHQLAFAIIQALGAELQRCDIVDLHDSTFFAQLVLQSPDGATTAVVDARPSDGIALALRGAVPIRVAEAVLEQVRTDQSGPDPLPGLGEGQEGPPE